MKRSWYDRGDSSGTLADYKRQAPATRPPTRGSRSSVQGIKAAMVRSSGRNYKKRPRRRFRRRIFRRRRIVKLQPWSQTVELKTHHLHTGDVAAAIGTATVALNGANDPYLAGGAEQPLGFDQWSTLYRKYVVIGWKMDLEIVTTDNTYPICVGFCPLTTSTALASYEAYKEVPGNVSVTLTPDIDKAFLVSKGNVERYLLGNKKRGRMLSDDQIYADTSANPTRPLYGHYYIQALDQASNPGTVYCSMTLRQIIVFFDPVVPGRS